MALAFIPPQAYAKGGRTVIVKENGSAGKRFLVIYDNVNSQRSGDLPNLTNPPGNTKNIAATSDCEDVYFAPDDHNHEHPLQKPHPEFMKSYRQAKAGDAMEQRNVSVSYDAGYLVNACPEKAHYWYQKAASKGDQIAQDWIARFNKLKAIHDGPEFITVRRVISPQALALAPK
ncbi:MAG: sel1 repeat family protein [Nitrosomonadales bacterium]|nr:sel1 repeat family protein [Nitrosomonadales bacterium]